MSLRSNSVYCVGPEFGPGLRMRILHMDGAGAQIKHTDDESSGPIPLSREDIKELRWEPAEDPWEGLRATHDDDIAPLLLRRRDRAHKGIQLLQAIARKDAPGGCHPHLRLLNTTHRFRLLKQAATELKVPKNSMRRWLNRWWTRGMCKNAMLTDVETMSGLGTTRAVPLDACDSVGNLVDPNRYKKPGRPAKNGERRGTRMTWPVRTSIETLGRELYFKHTRNSVPDAYVMWKDSKKTVAPRSYPTPQAFYDVLTKYPAVRAEIKRRGLVGRKPRGGAAEKDAMHTRVPGPGFCYQGDSTPLPRIKVDGVRTTLYFCSDTRVSGITGYYVHKGGPSAAAHSRSLAHAASDKVSYCARYNVSITRDQWPMDIVPEAWIADRGELIGPIADYLVSEFDLVLQNTPAYSPQLKADVEAAFGALLRSLISKLDTKVKPRPGRRYGETIELTMHELHVLIILFILEYNSRKLPRVPTPNQVAKKVPMTPLGLWNKELDLLTGEGRKFSERELLIATSKRTKGTEAKLDESGLLFEDLTYDCFDTGVAELQSQLGGRRKAVHIFYNEDITDQVFIQRKELRRIRVATTGPLHEFIECRLSTRDKSWAGYTFPEFKEAYSKLTEETQGLYENHDERKAALMRAIADQNAGKSAAPEPSPQDESSVDYEHTQNAAPAEVAHEPEPAKTSSTQVTPPATTHTAVGGMSMDATRRARRERTNSTK